MKPIRSLFLVFMILVLVFRAEAGSIDRGYQALNQYDYFKAKKYFTRGLKYNTSAAAQGLAIIYYRTDNPFHSYDSALVYIQKAHTKWFVTKERRRVLYEKYGFTEDSIVSLRQAVSTKFFEFAHNSGEVEPLSEFIINHPWAEEVNRAVELRDSLAFFQVVSTNTSNQFKHYVETYPSSAYVSLAQENYNNLIFEETTTSDNLASYVEFVTLYPENPNLEIAEEKIYQIVTSPNTTEAFEIFIQKYPTNRFVDKAWRELFQSYLAEHYSKEYLESFLVNYPGYPFQSEVIAEAELADSLFLPWKEKDLFGFITTTGSRIIPELYSSVSFFSEGLSVVELDDKIGFINKLGVLQIPCQFESASEFHSGRAIVECDGKMGMIDRNGRFLLPCEYDDIGLVSHSLVYASQKDKYGYFDIQGKLRIEMMFEDAYDFTDDGVAKVQIDGKQGFIDIYGGFAVPPAYERIAPFYDTLFIFEEDGLVGLMNHKCQIFLEPKFVEIGQLSEGLAVAVLAENDEVVYIDTLGSIKIQNGFKSFPNYLLFGEFHDSRSVVFKEGKYGRIDNTGKIVTPFKQESIGRGASFFPFEKEGLWGLMTDKNEIVIKVEYDAVELIGNKYLIVTKNDTLGMTSSAGNFLLPLSFKSIVPLKEDLFIVENDEGFGLYWGNKILTEHKYNQVGLFNEDFVFLVEDDRMVYYDINQSKLIEALE